MRQLQFYIILFFSLHAYSQEVTRFSIQDFRCMIRLMLSNNCNNCTHQSCHLPKSVCALILYTFFYKSDFKIIFQLKNVIYERKPACSPDQLYNQTLFNCKSLHVDCEKNLFLDQRSLGHHFFPLYAKKYQTIGLFFFGFKRNIAVYLKDNGATCCIHGKYKKGSTDNCYENRFGQYTLCEKKVNYFCTFSNTYGASTTLLRWNDKLLNLVLYDKRCLDSTPMLIIDQQPDKGSTLYCNKYMYNQSGKLFFCNVIERLKEGCSYNMSMATDITSKSDESCKIEKSLLRNISLFSSNLIS